MTNQLRVRDFIGGPMRDFSDYSNRRAIPHILDGFNMSQRKVIAAALKKESVGKIKVSTMASVATEDFNYHHGDSILDTVVLLAQDFAGSNNVPLLVPLGQFGNAQSKEYPAPRYIHTKLQLHFHDYFLKTDQEITVPQISSEDGSEIEPPFYIPLVPFILVNGANGVGSGYSSFMLQHDPKDLRNAVKQVLKDPNTNIKLTPKLLGWSGTINKDSVTGQVEFIGTLIVVNKTTINITELPPQYDLIKYKTHLNDMVERGTIKEYNNGSRNGKWFFEIICKRELVDNNTVPQLLAMFGLIRRETETVVCWGVDNKIRHYTCTEDLLKDWVIERVKLAEQSFQHQLTQMKEQLALVKLRVSFVIWWVDNSNLLLKLGKAGLTEQIKAQFKEITPEEIDRLLNIRIYNLTTDEVDRMKQSLIDMESSYVALSTQNSKEIYIEMINKL